MASGKLSSVLKLFDNDPTPEEQDDLKREVMLLVLARATAADTNIKDVEIEKVREVLTAHLNTEFDASEVRVAANSERCALAPARWALEGRGALVWRAVLVALRRGSTAPSVNVLMRSAKMPRATCVQSARSAALPAWSASAN